MRTEIDEFLRGQKFDALWVIGNMVNNPDMVYFTHPQKVSDVDLFKIVGKEPVVFHATSMEREEAAKSGLKTYALDSIFPFGGYLKETNNDMEIATALRYKDIFEKIDLKNGRVCMAGIAPISASLSKLDALRILLPEIEFVGTEKDSAIQMARMTKDPDEVGRIRKMGQITMKVVDKVARFLTNSPFSGNTLIDSEKKPLTIAAVKKRINLWLAELGVENPEETIFSIGRDAGIPHNSGNPNDPIELGKPIVFDIFPCEKGGGYFYDFTRTWCLGYAPPEIQKLHEQVNLVHKKIIKSLKVGEPFKKYQKKTCELFSSMGHVTIAEKPGATEGYIHSIGHGLGLEIHENPFSGITATENDILKPGVVFTIEPGLYYPLSEVGVRIEDTIYLNPDGSFEILAEYPYDLVLPMK